MNIDTPEAVATLNRSLEILAMQQRFRSEVVLVQFVKPIEAVEIQPVRGQRANSLIIDDYMEFPQLPNYP